ncbi:thymidylate synthase/pyrimidine hydroxymethylase-like protein [Oryctes rhinoceros nudivirus]|uniref:thymidylate synthase n=1 Tax=Oryctes rhinoceros nudivirus TaxID=92521 RepID=A3QU09_9VIRU|nr:thymidylate synthase/pyrimidine hydroxymethylase-like protein [Oryctes rhinoceros nudivirus]ABF93345.1 putative thymidylate synthase [Oryctes rhinoceros nudivirus]ACH96136.1 thymidylate synthase/pyrimidine hydroxymethylase-like protein [Oryctes rhinoceros nudivirus]QHG11245.1 thymidylate synthase/pyrimidine hydroxymethylase-like protein [Oryctes rhinoceros nudivirus]QKE59480.1 thymidylate synthase/pyrimidine hydroxymethylase-like protein [Oryctes rhinoceros nudivirus]UBO76427.1 thymidylate 
MLVYNYSVYNKELALKHLVYSPHALTVMTRNYLSLVRTVLKAPSSPNRTGIDARSSFGHQLRFDLRNGVLPLLTTKPMPFKTILRELFWFLRGETNQKILERQNVHIWKGNSSREYLDSRGLYDYTEYESLGPIYGFQWRHFGASYVDCNTDYTNKGVDQLQQVIRTIKEDPTSRRIIMSAWNPVDLDKMALPPCHILVQFHVNTVNGELSAQLYQRSADLMLGVPFNIASYSILVHLIAKICGLKPGYFIHSLGDVHIYENHVSGAKEQLTREPQRQPYLNIDIDPTLDLDSILEQLSCDQFKLVNYKYNPNPIKLEMAV